MSPADTARKLVDLGGAAVKSKDFEKAEACFDRAIAADVASVDAWAGLARCQRERREYAKAESSSRRALMLDESSVEAWVQFGGAVGALNRLDEAEDACNHALSLDHRCARALSILAAIRFRQSRVENTLQLVERSIALDPGLEVAWFIRGYQRYHGGNLTGSLDDALIALGIDPGFGHAVSLAARVYNDLGEDGRAISLCRESLPRLRCEIEKQTIEASLAIIEERPWGAVVAYKRLIDLDPTVPEYRVWLGTTYFNLGRRDEAMDVLTEAVRLAPDSPTAHYMLGYLYLYRRDADSARRHLKRLQKLDTRRAAQLRRALLPCERQRIHGYGMLALCGWAVFGGMIDSGGPLMGYPLYQAAGGAIFAGYFALTLRVNRHLRESKNLVDEPVEPSESGEDDGRGCPWSGDE